MNLLIALAALAVPALAMAHPTFTPFAPPPGVRAAVPAGAMHCAGNAYNAKGKIRGACASPHAYPCSGRGCQPVTVTRYYNATWAADGAPISAILCMSIRHHLPQPDRYTYYNGFAARDCKKPELRSQTVVMINRGSGPSPYYLIATSPSGLTEIVADGSRSYLVTF